MQLPQYFFNGQLSGEISAYDRGLAYGDGLFETCRIVRGKLPLRELHMARLFQGAAILKIDIDNAEINCHINSVLALIDAKAIEHCLLKIIVTRGVGGRGYKTDSGVKPNYLIFLLPATAHVNHTGFNGVSVRFCEHRLNSCGILGGIKHLNRLDQIVARLEWQDEVDDGLLCDASSNLVESISGNIFAVIDGQCVTPLLQEVGVRGVLRQWLIEKLNARNIDVIERDISREEVLMASEVFITNAVVGVLPIIRIHSSENQLLKSLSIGSITQLGQQMISEIF